MNLEKIKSLGITTIIGLKLDQKTLDYLCFSESESIVSVPNCKCTMTYCHTNNFCYNCGAQNNRTATVLKKTYTSYHKTIYSSNSTLYGFPVYEYAYICFKICDNDIKLRHAKIKKTGDYFAAAGQKDHDDYYDNIDPTVIFNDIDLDKFVVFKEIMTDLGIFDQSRFGIWTIVEV